MHKTGTNNSLAKQGWGRTLQTLNPESIEFASCIVSSPVGASTQMLGVEYWAKDPNSSARSCLQTMTMPTWRC